MDPLAVLAYGAEQAPPLIGTINTRCTLHGVDKVSSHGKIRAFSYGLMTLC